MKGHEFSDDDEKKTCSVGILSERSTLLPEFGSPASSSLPNAQESVESIASSQSSDSSPHDCIAPPPSLHRTNFGKNNSYIPPIQNYAVITKAEVDDNMQMTTTEDQNTVCGHISISLHSNTSQRSSAYPTVYEDEEDSLFGKDQKNSQPIHLTAPHVSILNRSASPSDMTRDNNPFDEGENEDEPPSLRSTPSRSIEANTNFFYMASPRITGPTSLPSDQSFPATSSSAKQTTPESVAKVVSLVDVSQTEFELAGKDRDQPDEDNDSLFDFDGKCRTRLTGKFTLDEDSSEFGPLPTLQERAQAAWKRKQAKVKAAPSADNLQVVSFGNDTPMDHHTYHHQQPDETTVGTETYHAGRSLNSVYTKSVESEVEDFIKDIFMIGKGHTTNPGRRKIKYSSAVQRKLQQQAQDEDSEASFTNEEDEPTVAEKQPADVRKKTLNNTSRAPRQGIDEDEKKNDEGDPLAQVWEYMESVGAAFGIEDEAKARAREQSPNSSTNARSINSCLPTCEGYANDDKVFSGIWDKLTGTILGNCVDPEETSVINRSQADEDDHVPVPDEDSVDGPVEEHVPVPPSLDEDLRLVDLAIESARSIHKLHGYEFDESYEINIAKDIQFSVVDLPIPFGVIFHENKHGCWITKILSGGSAAESGQVRVGDQLAAVDGISAISMKVDDIASVIKKKTGLVELTFLRFIGELHPLAEQAYEVGSSNPPKTTVRLPAVGSQRPQSAGALKHDSNPRMQADNAFSESLLTPSKDKKKFRLFGRRKA
jgi:hypothetical protein